mmetsp:Transcript_25043/g.54598  ORF Transcript_25043/g.54598 Transcript_25043/m.54598 type:complete len:261 (+) Transcript_25043:2101-2883(+)
MPPVQRTTLVLPTLVVPTQSRWKLALMMRMWLLSAKPSPRLRWSSLATVVAPQMKLRVTATHLERVLQVARRGRQLIHTPPLNLTSSLMVPRTVPIAVARRRQLQSAVLSLDPGPMYRQQLHYRFRVIPAARHGLVFHPFLRRLWHSLNSSVHPTFKPSGAVVVFSIRTANALRMEYTAAMMRRVNFSRYWRNMLVRHPSEVWAILAALMPKQSSLRSRLWPYPQISGLLFDCSRSQHWDKRVHLVRKPLRQSLNISWTL